MKPLSRALLKAYRAAHGLTQAELGARLCVHRVTVANWERGLYPVPGWLGVVVQVMEPRQKKGG